MPRDAAVCRRCGYRVVTEMPDGTFGTARDMYHWRMCESRKNWPAWTYAAKAAGQKRREAANQDKRHEVAVIERPEPETRKSQMDEELAALEEMFGGVPTPVVMDTADIPPELDNLRRRLDAELEALEIGGESLPVLGEQQVAVTGANPLACPICGFAAASAGGRGAHMRKHRG